MAAKKSSKRSNPPPVIPLMTFEVVVGTIEKTSTHRVPAHQTRVDEHGFLHINDGGNDVAIFTTWQSVMRVPEPAQKESPSPRRDP